MSEPDLESVIRDYLWGWDYMNLEAIEGLANHIKQLFRCSYEPVIGEDD
jgi:hypothetical protein